GIEHNPSSLAPLHFNNARGELVAPRRRRPANIANVVALLIFAQTLELPALAALAAPALFHFNLPAADQIQCVLASLLQIGKHTHRLRSLGHRPSLREPQPALVAQE